LQKTETRKRSRTRPRLGELLSGIADNLSFAGYLPAEVNTSSMVAISIVAASNL